MASVEELAAEFWGHPARMNPNLLRQGMRGRANMTPPDSVMDPRWAAHKERQGSAEKFMLGVDAAGFAGPVAGLAKFVGPVANEVARGYMGRAGLMPELTVWHGSPHRFAPTKGNPLGEFDLGKVGTGEGAQAYGHGTYLAENPGVAKTYSEQLARANFKSLSQSEQNAILPQLGALHDVATKNGVDAAKNLLDSHIQNLIGIAKYEPSKQNIDALNALRKLKANGEFAPELSKNLYKVDLPDEQIAKMLDWDKPLTATPNGRAALDGLIPKLDAESVKLLKQDAGRLDGSGLVTWAQRVYGKDGASDYLQSHGIPGIRYLDAGSRGAGEGTRNFVLFEPGLAKIIGRE